MRLDEWSNWTNGIQMNGAIGQMRLDVWSNWTNKIRRMEQLDK